jgi:conjugative transfer signal peptidase TraF
MREQRRIVLAATAGLVMMAVSAKVAYCAGWRVNLTPSAPRGLYHLRPLTTVVIPRGALVELCPPAWVTPAAFPFYLRGDCPSGGRALLKTIVGVPGDQVAVTEDGVSVNGLKLPGSVPRLLSKEPPEVSLPFRRGAVVLRSEQYWVYGSGERPDQAAWSFDSRYFGPVSIGHIRGAVISVYSCQTAVLGLRRTWCDLFGSADSGR